MASSVIRTLSGFGLVRPVHSCYIPTEEGEVEDKYEEELREDSSEEGSFPPADIQEDELWCENLSVGHTEMTDRLLRFAELISTDVQRYFGHGHNSDACDIYEDKLCSGVSGRQRYYADFMKVASSEQCEEPEKLGPLAELFKEAHKKRQGLPMTQRHLPSSFWREPCPFHHFGEVNMPDLLSCSTGHMLRSTNTPVSTLDTPVSTINSSGTPDFSDLLAHWATDRDSASEFSCDYQLP